MNLRNFLLPLAAIALIAAAAWVSFDLGYSSVPPSRTVSFSAPAVTPEGKGLMVPFKLSIAPGSGRLLVDVGSVSFKEDTELSLRKARAAAEKYLDAPLDWADIVLSFDAGDKVVAGESAGAAFALAITAAYLGKPLKGDVALSAALTDDGTVSPVEGIEEKIIAARASNKGVFLVASSQQIKHEEQLVNATGVTIIRVNGLEEAAKYALG
ncbi:MAG: hypothetical protein NTY90_05430 [Candidatus Micrarchaeota archaeon]|nr:hypothetical protein [Candidatus Micrarchaeota archaeon]